VFHQSNLNRSWTDYDDWRLQTYASTMETPQLAIMLNRTESAVRTRAFELGISLMPPDPPTYWPYGGSW
jgi:hypothetical protein